jgi:hypothetical protein
MGCSTTSVSSSVSMRRSRTEFSSPPQHLHALDIVRENLDLRPRQAHGQIVQNAPRQSSRFFPSDTPPFRCRRKHQFMIPFFA